uniref:Putative ovule protein n=1 Tax=Solanum chacoense TaxID=4108 RepID=A0A0V0GPX9_SOLCH
MLLLLIFLIMVHFIEFFRCITCISCEIIRLFLFHFYRLHSFNFQVWWFMWEPSAPFCLKVIYLYLDNPCLCYFGPSGTLMFHLKRFLKRG